MLGPGGFSSARDIAAITVNRWPHGYSYVANSLFDPDDYDDTVLKAARQTRRPRRHRQHRRRRRRLGALRHRPGEQGGDRACRLTAFYRQCPSNGRNELTSETMKSNSARTRGTLRRSGWTSR